MKEPVKFKCPRCGCEANAYSQVMAGCVMCGVLLYTDIPQEVKSQLTMRAADVLPCGHHSNNLRLGVNGYGCAECEATRR